MSLLSLDQIKTLYDDLRGRIEDGGSVIKFLPVDNASGSIATFPDGADNVPVKSLVAQITPVQAGTGDPAPDNIRPISGWTGAKITDNGKNLIPYPYVSPSGTVSSEITFTTDAQGRISASGTTTGSVAFYLVNGLSLPSGEYTFSSDTSSSELNVVLYDETTASTVNGLPREGGSATVTLDGSHTYSVRLSRSGAGRAISITNLGVQLEAGSTASAFTPYKNPNIVNIDWTSEGTVYGGTLTYLGSGKYSLQATHKKDTFTWADGTNATTVSDYTRKNFALTSLALTSSGMTSNIAPFMQGQTSNPVPHTDFSTSSVARVYLPTTTDNATSIELLYTFATLPDPIILDAEDVKTLLGDNNIFCDTGDVSVDYRADIALYIQKVVNA